MNESFTLSERFSKLREAIDAGLVCRNRWEKVEKDGKRLACLLLHVAPEIREYDYDGESRFDVTRCPAKVLPKWLAILTIMIDDSPSSGAWMEILRRYADVIGRAATQFDAIAWSRAECRVRMVCIAEVLFHTSNPEIHDLCERAIDLYDRVLRGEVPPVDMRNALQLSIDQLSESTDDFEVLTDEHEVMLDLTRAIDFAIDPSASAIEKSARMAVVHEEGANRLCHAIFDVIEAELAAS